MIIGLDDYEIYVRNLLKKVPILKTRQLILALVNYFADMTEDLALSILFALQRKGYVLLSEDGWSMTQGMYLKITDDKFFDGIIKNNAYRIPEEVFLFGIDKDGKYNKLKRLNIEDELDKKQKELINCMWVVVDMLPDSAYFSVSNEPWNVVFTSDPNEDNPGYLYEVVYIHKRTEDIQIELIKNTPAIDLHELRDNIKRIAIMEDEKHDWKIPYLGFTHIVKINEEKQNGYEVVGKPRSKEEKWKDYVV